MAFSSPTADCYVLLLITPFIDKAKGREYTSANTSLSKIFPSLSFISILKEGSLYFKSLVLSKKATLIYLYDIAMSAAHVEAKRTSDATEVGL